MIACCFDIHDAMGDVSVCFENNDMNLGSVTRRT